MHPFVVEAVRALRSTARRGVVFAVCCGIAVAVAAGINMTRPRTWTVTTVFIPEAGTSTTSSALTSQLGLGGSSMDSPDFYAEFLSTDEALRSAVRRRYARAGAAHDSVSLASLLGTSGQDTAQAYEKTSRALRARMVVAVVRRAGVVRVTVTLPDPLVAQAVAAELITTINDLNSRVRQTRGRLDRQFAEERVAAVRHELTLAEDSLQAFMQANREPITAPRLLIEKMRIQRSVSQRTSVLGALEVSYEQARSREVENTPRISVVQPPVAPVAGDSRDTLRIATLTLIGTALALVLLFYAADVQGGGSVGRLLVHWRTMLAQAGRTA